MSAYTKYELENMLEDIINELDLSKSTIEKYGSLAIEPSKLVKLVLEEKNMKISILELQIKQLLKYKNGKYAEKN